MVKSAKIVMQYERKQILKYQAKCELPITNKL